MSLDLSKIKKLPFPENQYYKEVYDKNQIVLHHTASGKGIDGDYTHWLTDPNRIATCIIIDRDGQINQLFSSKYWGHHLGIKSSFLKQKGYKDYNNRNVLLNKNTIGIEIDSWGPLSEINGKYYSYTKKEIPIEDVCILDTPFRGYKYYEKYTNEQIKTVKELLQYWNKIYNIPLTYNNDIWDVSNRALNGDKGVFTHCSYRTDKTDIFPQKEMITMLRSL